MKYFALLAAACLAAACTPAQLQQVQTTLPAAIAGQSVAVRSLGGPIDLDQQQKLVARGADTAARQRLVSEYRATRAKRLGVTRTTIEAVAKAAAGLSADLAQVDEDLRRNDQQIDEQIATLGVEGHPVVPSSPAIGAAPVPPPDPPAAAPPPAAPAGAAPSSPPAAPAPAAPPPAPADAAAPR